MPREFDESGQFKMTTTLDDVFAAFDDVDDPVVTTGEIAAAAECSRESARQKLTRLFDQGRIDKKKSGQSLVWWRKEEPERQLRRLSLELDEAIIVGDTVYEDGEQHALSDAQTDRDESAVEEGETDE